MHQVFNNSRKWRVHHNAISGWIRNRPDNADINPFLKTWIAMVDTQSALNLGAQTLPAVDKWLESCQHWEKTQNTVDPFFGCSVQLPRLMVSCVRSLILQNAVKG